MGKGETKFVILEFLYSVQVKWLIINIIIVKVVWTVSSYLVVQEYFRKILNGVTAQISQWSPEVDWI